MPQFRQEFWQDCFTALSWEKNKKSCKTVFYNW